MTKTTDEMRRELSELLGKLSWPERQRVRLMLKRMRKANKSS
jgi:hypothetical protein